MAFQTPLYNRIVAKSLFKSPTVDWQLNAYLKKLGKKPIELEEKIRALEHTWGKKTVYRFTSGSPKRVDLESLGIILHALSEFEGRVVTIDDLLNFNLESNAEEGIEDVKHN